MYCELYEARWDCRFAGRAFSRAKRAYRSDPTPAKDRKMEKARNAFDQARRTWAKMVILKNASL